MSEMSPVQGVDPSRLPISELTLYLQWKVDSRAHERVSSMGLRLLDVIARHTLGWHKRTASLSLTLMAAGSGLYRQRVPALLRELEAAGLVLIERPAGAERRGNRPSTVTIVVPIEQYVKYRGKTEEGAAPPGGGLKPPPAPPADSDLIEETVQETDIEESGDAGSPLDGPGVVPGADQGSPGCGPGVVLGADQGSPGCGPGVVLGADQGGPLNGLGVVRSAD
jgi:hypothetical protein